MTVLFVTVLLAWLLYEFVAQVIADVKAKKMNEAYKKLRDIAEGKTKDNGSRLYGAYKLSRMRTRNQ